MVAAGNAANSNFGITAVCRGIIRTIYLFLIYNDKMSLQS